MKQTQLFHIPISDAQNQTYEDYEKDIQFLKQHIAHISADLEKIQTQQLQVQDQFETNLERLAYFSAILHIQYVILQKCIKVDECQPLNLDFVQHCEEGCGAAFTAARQQVKQLIARACALFEDLGVSDENGHDKSLRSKQFIQNVSEQNMLITQISSLEGLGFGKVMLDLQSAVLSQLRLNWPLRAGKADVVNGLAKTAASAASKAVSDALIQLHDLQHHYEELVTLHGAGDSIKLLQEIEKMRAVLGEPEPEQHLEIPQYINNIREFDMPEPQIVKFTREFAGIPEKLQQLGAFQISRADLAYIKESQAVVDCAALEKFNIQAENALQKYEELCEILERGVGDADAACEAIDIAEQFEAPKAPEAPAHGPLQLQEVEQVSDIAQYATSADETLKLVDSEATALVSALNAEEEAQIAIYRGNICANLKKAAQKMQALEKNVATNAETASQNLGTASVEASKLHASVMRMLTIRGDNATQIYLDVKRNFCQICKTQPVRSMLPCGHLYCSKCIRDRPGRKQFCPKCTNPYQENQIVQLSKELFV